MKVIPYGRQHITEDDIREVVNVLRSDYLTQGPRIDDFEKAFAAYIGAQYAVAVSNGTAALHLSVLALGLTPGDKVITSPITFAASANAVLYAHGEVVFADIDETTYLLDCNKVRELLEKAPKGTYKGLIPVDFTGLPADMEEFHQLASEHGLWLLEDACHAPGGFFYDSRGVRQNCGNGIFADLAMFSFHPVKHIASGEGGMITTNNEKLYHKLKALRTHGITKNPETNQGGWYYEMTDLGFNYRITDIQAALGASQLKRAQKGLQRRKEIASTYDKAFEDLGIVRQKRPDKYQNAYHLYVIEVEKRKELYDFLRSKEIYAQVHYIPVHLHPYYRQFGWKAGDFPLAEAYYERALSLPMYPSLTHDDQAYVIQTVKSFFE